MITMVGVMYWAPKVLRHYSCENFGIAQWFYCQLILFLMKFLVVKLIGSDQGGESNILGTQSGQTLFLRNFWHHVVVLMVVDFIFDESFGAIKQLCG